MGLSTIRKGLKATANARDVEGTVLGCYHDIYIGFQGHWSVYSSITAIIVPGLSSSSRV